LRWDLKSFLVELNRVLFLIFFCVWLGFLIFFGFFFLFCFFFVCLCFGGSGGFSGFLDFEGVSFLLVFLTVYIYFFCVFSRSEEKSLGWIFPSFLGFLSFILFFLVVRFSCVKIILFYACFEFVFLLMFFFVMRWGYRVERLQASFYIVFYTLVVSFPFLIYILLGEVVSTSFVGFFSFEGLWWIFFVLVFLVKLPAYGVHLWLPKAHVEAPVSGSMLLAGLLLKLGIYGIVRFSFFVNSSLFLFFGYLVSIGLLGGVLCCVLCLRQIDLKAFVAYSSICHMGICLGGVYSISV